MLEDFVSLSYSNLVSKDDLKHIKVLSKYMKFSFREKVYILTKRLFLPICFSFFVGIYYLEETIRYLLFFVSFIFGISLVGELIYNEYYKSYLNKLDEFIESYNKELIRKNRYIYRKNKLIMFLVLKSNQLEDYQIKNEIEKIMSL